METRNYVAKYSRQVNRATIQVDRKKASKRGATKHKGRQWSDTAL